MNWLLRLVCLCGHRNLFLLKVVEKELALLLQLTELQLLSLTCRIRFLRLSGTFVQKYMLLLLYFSWLITKEFLELKVLTSRNLRFVFVPKVLEMMLELVSKLFWVLIGLRVGWQHLQISVVVHIEAAVGHDLN